MKSIIYQYKCSKCGVNHIMDNPIEVKIDNDIIKWNKNLEIKYHEEDSKNDKILDDFNKTKEQFSKIVEEHNKEECKKLFAKYWNVEIDLDNRNIFDLCEKLFENREISVIDSKGKTIKYKHFNMKTYYNISTILTGRFDFTKYIECPTCSHRTMVG